MMGMSSSRDEMASFLPPYVSENIVALTCQIPLTSSDAWPTHLTNTLMFNFSRTCMSRPSSFKVVRVGLRCDRTVPHALLLKHKTMFTTEPRLDGQRLPETSEADLLHDPRVQPTPLRRPTCGATRRRQPCACALHRTRPAPSRKPRHTVGAAPAPAVAARARGGA
jgi:hypothetical protein